MSTKNTTSPDLSPAVAIGGNAIEDTAALYDGDDTTPTREQLRALRSEAAEAGDDAQVELCDRALAGDETARAECAEAIEAAALRAEQLADGWSVIDPDGGRWWPRDEARTEIETADDPGAVAVRICQEQPMRGEWRA